MNPLGTIDESVPLLVGRHAFGCITLCDHEKTMTRTLRVSRTEDLPSDPRYRAYFDLFNAGEYFESHEVLEAIWLEESGPDRLFLQGLIQLAASLHHLQRGNARSARNLLDMGSAKLAGYPTHHAGLSVARFVGRIRDYVEARMGRPLVEAAPPQVQLD